jgi:hypothetical protein
VCDCVFAYFDEVRKTETGNNNPLVHGSDLKAISYGDGREF